MTRASFAPSFAPSSGDRLDAATHGRMGRGLSASFADVRVHATEPRIQRQTQDDTSGTEPIGVEPASPEASTPETPGGFCTPYTPEEARRVKARLRRTLLPAQLGLFGPAVFGLYRDFLRRKPGDSLEPRVFGPSTTLARTFTHARATRNAEWLVFAMIDSFPKLPPGTTRFTLEELEAGGHVAQRDGMGGFAGVAKQMSFSQVWTRPGNTAGGVSGSDLGEDSRSVTGSVEVVYDEVEGRLIMHPDLHFVVRDVIDFCPGGKGASTEERFTVPLSRLEASGEAYDVPFQVEFPGPGRDHTKAVRLEGERHVPYGALLPEMVDPSSNIRGG